MEIDEKTLEIIVDNAVKRIISEMSIKRGKFVTQIVGELVQIFENWCLLRYYKVSGKRTRNQSHWRRELRTHIMSIHTLTLRGNKSYAYKYNAIMETFDTFDLFDHNVIDARISGKFIEEGISRKDRLYSEVVDDCIRNHKKLIHVLASPINTALVDEFIEELVS